MARYNETDMFDEKAEKDFRKAIEKVCKKYDCQFIADDVEDEIDSNDMVADGTEMGVCADIIVTAFESILIGGRFDPPYSIQKTCDGVINDFCKEIGLSRSKRTFRY